MSSDPVHDQSPAGLHWSRNNTGEAVPGVLTPMAWDLFGRITESSARSAFCSLGILPRSAVPYPADPGERMLGIFHGRYAINAAVVRRMFSSLPGVSGEDVERDILGYVTGQPTDDAYPWRLPVIAVKAPRRVLGTGAEANALRTDAQHWWELNVGPSGPRPGVRPTALFVEALERFGAAMHLQARTRILFQATSARVLELATHAGAPECAGSLMAGAAGVEEGDVADELWRVAQGKVSLDAFLARHGFHGPNSGDIATRSWREEPAPVERLLDAVGRSERPSERRARSQAERDIVLAEVLGKLSPRARLGARVTLRFGPAAARHLELGKTSFLIALDGARAAARAIGDGLVADGVLAARDDVFLLLPDELLAAATTPGALGELVGERRDARARHMAVDLPATWTGQPQPVTAPAVAPDDVGVVAGAGVSAGIVEGRVRVVMDPADDVDIELGDILVAPTTDPSWVSLMTVAAALVIDIGTTASHGAIIARELGVPCVIGTASGTRVLRDGDLVRVDGARGGVDVLARDTPDPTPARTP